jgi:hypothetical protein
MMEIINGLSHFKEAVTKVDQHQNKTDAWMGYYYKYGEIFNTIFEKLYMTDLDTIKAMVNTVDFNQLAQQAEGSLLVNSIKNIHRIIGNCNVFFDFQKDYDVFLLVGLGHIDGTALNSSKPFLYFGLERLQYINVENLIQHEFNHLVRFNSISEFESITKMSVGQLAVAEGLATLTPLVINKMEFSDINISKALFISEQELSEFKNNKDKIIENLNNDFDKELTPSLMAEYFMMNEDSELGKSGYFYGVQIIKLLMEKGWNLRNLTVLDTQSIIAEYRRHCEKLY